MEGGGGVSVWVGVGADVRHMVCRDGCVETGLRWCTCVYVSNDVFSCDMRPHKQTRSNTIIVVPHTYYYHSLHINSHNC